MHIYTARPSSLPDIICFPNIRSSASAHAPSLSRKTVILVDAIFTGDRTMSQRFSAEVLHHQLYVDNLRAHGWAVHFYPIVLTFSGCISDSFRTMLHSHCGLSNSQLILSYTPSNAILVLTTLNLLTLESSLNFNN